jgi:hypothetical protein
MNLTAIIIELCAVELLQARIKFAAVLLTGFNATIRMCIIAASRDLVFFALWAIIAAATPRRHYILEYHTSSIFICTDSLTSLSIKKRTF